MPQPKKLVTQTDLANLLGISRQTVNRMCKGRFAPAFVGKKLDVEHPSILEYIEEKEAKETADLNINSDDDNESPVIIPGEDISFEDIENLTVREVVERYGTIAGFKLYLDSLRGMADWKNKELKFQMARGELVAINPLASSLFSLIDLSWKRIVAEFPGAIAPQLKAIVLSSPENAVIEMRGLMEKELSQILKGVKTKITRDLKQAQKSK